MLRNNDPLIGADHANFTLTAKGIGINPASARQNLEKNFADELGAGLLESEQRMFARSPQ